MKHYYIIRLLDDDTTVTISEPMEWDKAQVKIKLYRLEHPDNVYHIKVVIDENISTN